MFLDHNALTGSFIGTDSFRYSERRYLRNSRESRYDRRYRFGPKHCRLINRIYPLGSAAICAFSGSIFKLEPRLYFTLRSSTKLAYFFPWLRTFLLPRFPLWLLSFASLRGKPRVSQTNRGPFALLNSSPLYTHLDVDGSFDFSCILLGHSFLVIVVF